MSRIHEAMEKARLQRPGSAPELPNVQEIIAAGVTLPEPARAAKFASDDGPNEILESSADSGSILANIRHCDWQVEGSNLSISSRASPMRPPKSNSVHSAPGSIRCKATDR